MTDAFTDELFRLDDGLARSVVFPVSRLIVDPERFVDDAIEPMSQRGMGVIYTRTATGGLLRNHPDEKTRQALLAAYYEPHHERLTQSVAASLERWNACLVIDCHSFPSVPLPYELDQSGDRPEICLGTDPFHSSEKLVTAAVAEFRDAGFQVELNRPFTGALVPGAYYRSDSRVMAIMIEVNRALYMHEASGNRLPSFGHVASKLQTAVIHVIERARTIAEIYGQR